VEFNIEVEFTIEVDMPAAPLIGYELFRGARTVTLSGGAVLEFRDLREQRDGAVLELVLSFASGVASSLVASWLYDKLGKCVLPRRLRINRTEVRFDQDDIERFIRERIELDEGDQT
jgi:hypothetical protein